MPPFQQECHYHIIPSQNELLLSHFPLSVIHCLQIPQISQQGAIKQYELQLLLPECELTKMFKINFANLCEQQKIYPQKATISLLRALRIETSQKINSNGIIQLAALATMLRFQSGLSSSTSENFCCLRKVLTFLLTYAKMHAWKSSRPTLPLLIFSNILNNLQVKATNFNTGSFVFYEH